MLRSAAKNYQSVTVVTDPADYSRLQEEMQQSGGATTAAFRALCARKVFRQTSRYDALIADELTRVAVEDSVETAEEERFPTEFAIPLRSSRPALWRKSPSACSIYGLRLPGAHTLSQATQRNGKSCPTIISWIVTVPWNSLKSLRIQLAPSSSTPTLAVPLVPINSMPLPVLGKVTRKLLLVPSLPLTSHWMQRQLMPSANPVALLKLLSLQVMMMPHLKY